MKTNYWIARPGQVVHQSLPESFDQLPFVVVGMSGQSGGKSDFNSFLEQSKTKWVWMQFQTNIQPLKLPNVLILLL